MMPRHLGDLVVAGNNIISLLKDGDDYIIKDDTTGHERIIVISRDGIRLIENNIIHTNYNAWMRLDDVLRLIVRTIMLTGEYSWTPPLLRL